MQLQLQPDGWHRISHDWVGAVSMFYSMDKGVCGNTIVQYTSRQEMTPSWLLAFSS